MGGPELTGYVDALTPSEIVGWAYTPTAPDVPVPITIFVGGKYAATIRADIFRPDLQAAGKGDGRKAFRFDPAPYLSDGETPVRVAFAATGETVPNGRAKLKRELTPSGEDWDRLLRPIDDRPPMDRVRAYPEERWPLISVIVPNYNTPAKYVALAVRSVFLQEYPKWELCIADNKSTDPEVLSYLHSLEGTDPRIKLKFRDFNGGISASTNSAFALAAGDYCALLDADDELTPDALAEFAAAILEAPETDILFSDQDKIDEQGQPFEPFHKPVFSPVFFLGVMYVGHLLAARTSLIRQVQGCDSAVDKVQDFDLMLRLSDLTSRIRHIPKILYHWRTLPGSLAASSNAKDAISELQLRAVQRHVERHLLPVRPVSHPTLPHRVQLLPGRDFSSTRVSIIIPTKDAPDMIERCLGSIFRLTTHRNFEVIVVDTGTTDRRARAVLRQHPIRLLEDLRPFNFSRVNNEAAARATGDVLLFLNNDTEVVTPDWLQIMLAHLALPDVGAVGPLLLYPNGSVQHAGVVLGFRGTADHVMRGFPPESDGFAGSLACSREVSAVTAACLMMPRALYTELGGMNEAFATIYQDLDLCLKIRETGRTILFVANASLRHHESVSRGSWYDFVDRELIRDRWQEAFRKGDPYHNPNFTLNRHDYTLRGAS
jgi:GT2 family glycosyltransferase